MKNSYYQISYRPGDSLTNLCQYDTTLDLVVIIKDIKKRFDYDELYIQKFIWVHHLGNYQMDQRFGSIVVKSCRHNFEWVGVEGDGQKEEAIFIYQCSKCKLKETKYENFDSILPAFLTGKEFKVNNLEKEKQMKVIMEEITNHGYSIVTCGHCGSVLFFRDSEEDYECCYCGYKSEPCDFPDLDIYTQY